MRVGEGALANPRPSHRPFGELRFAIILKDDFGPLSLTKVKACLPYIGPGDAIIFNGSPEDAVMTQASKLSSPLEAEYAEYREAEERRRDTREWLERRERELGFVKDAPPVAPKAPER
jgi:hypothetical protein